MSYKIVWKLCDTEGHPNSGYKLVSAVAYSEGTKLEYKIGESTKPRVGLLFAFKTKKDALKSRPSINCAAIIVKCRARISRRPVPEKVAHFEYHHEYWNAVFGKIPRYTNGYRSMPPGTLFCTEVIPIEIDNEGEEE